MTQLMSPPDFFPAFRALRRSVACGFRGFARAIRRHLGFLIALGIVLMVAGLLVLDLLLGGRYVSRLPMYRIPPPGILHQTLHSRVQVKGWDENGLLLEDGRRVQLPGFTKLPLESAPLALEGRYWTPASVPGPGRTAQSHTRGGAVVVRATRRPL
jgi:hypothetical protein